MSTLFPLMGNTLVILGIAMLVIAVIRVSALLQRLPYLHLRRYWQFLRLMIVLFILGYAAFCLMHWNACSDWPQMLVPSVFFGGAIFVLVVCSLSLKTTRVVQEIHSLKKQTITDPLMGIFNRRYLDRRLGEEILLCRDHLRPLTLMMLDIDHFKRVNDTYGHPIGDLVLKSLGQALTLHTLASDVVARYGGEEVVVLLPGTNGNEAQALAKRLHKAIGKLRIPLPQQGHPSRGQLQFSVSIGVAGYNADNADANHLLQAADLALYQAKISGRNRVACCPDLKLAVASPS